MLHLSHVVNHMLYYLVTGIIIVVAGVKDKTNSC